jgi:hypothetical protein
MDEAPRRRWAHRRNPQVPVIRTGRSPHEILVCITALFIGGSGLIAGKTTSPAINAAFPPPWEDVYFFGLVVSALITLYGIARYRVEGLLIERAGLGVQAAFFLAYGIAVVSNRGWFGAAFAALPLCFFASNICRMVQIRRDLAALPEQLRHAVDLSDDRDDGAAGAGGRRGAGPRP